MILPKAPPHMFELANQTVDKFGYDNISGVQYTFNSLGYRSVEVTDSTPAVIFLGNTLTFGLGLEVDQTFVGLVSKELTAPVYNFSWGCYGHTNSEQLEFLKLILKEIHPKHIVMQINNLNRIRKNGQVDWNNSVDAVETEYNLFKNALHEVLGNIPHSLIHWDNEQYQLDFSDCLIYNKYHIDDGVVKTPLNENLFGVKTHKLIATKLLQNYDKRI